jgi:hypothetical protein
MTQRAHHTSTEEPKCLSPLFVATCFIMMIIGTIGISWMHFQAFTPMEETSHRVNPLSPALIKQFGGHPGIAHIGLIIENFREFNMMGNKFIFNGILWCRFDPTLVSLDTINNITISNGRFLEKSPPHTRLIGDLLFVRYEIQVEFQCNLNFDDFPLDDHKIYMIFSHPGVSPNSLIFESTRPDLVLLENLDKQGWLAFDHTTEVGYLSNTIQSSVIDLEFSHPTVIFSIDYRHNSMHDFLNIILPLLVMLGLVFFSYAIDREKYWKERLKAATEPIVGSIAFRFVIAMMSPKVGYTMASDKFFFMFLFMYLIMFLIALNTSKLTIMLERIIVISMTCAIILGTTLIWFTG